MALTDPQKADCRRWLGWPTLNDGEPDYVYGHSPSSISLASKLAALNTTDETILTDVYLTPLGVLETAIVSAAANLDTIKAGPWESNPREVAMRTSLFRQKANEMAAFIGFPTGPGMTSGGNSIAIVRC